jgi:hypothetical protein
MDLSLALGRGDLSLKRSHPSNDLGMIHKRRQIRCRGRLRIVVRIERLDVFDGSTILDCSKALVGETAGF